MFQKTGRQVADQPQGIISTRSYGQLCAHSSSSLTIFSSESFPWYLICSVSLQGIYVLHDYAFRWFQHFSSATNAPEEAAIHTHFPCGLIRGMLSSLGIKASVRAEVPALPKCTPHVVCPLPRSLHSIPACFNQVSLRMSSFYDTTPGSFTISVTNRANA